MSGLTYFGQSAASSGGGADLSQITVADVADAEGGYLHYLLTEGSTAGFEDSDSLLNVLANTVNMAFGGIAAVGTAAFTMGIDAPENTFTPMEITGAGVGGVNEIQPTANGEDLSVAFTLQEGIYLLNISGQSNAEDVTGVTFQLDTSAGYLFEGPVTGDGIIQKQMYIIGVMQNGGPQQVAINAYQTGSAVDAAVTVDAIFTKIG